jgi:hypothetical protein
MVVSRNSIRSVGSGVMVFSVSRSGTLRRVAGSPISIGRRPVAEALAFSPSGRFVAVGTDSGTISVFSVGRSGALRAVRGSPFRSSDHLIDAIAFSGSGLVATSNDDATISVLSMNAATGALRPVSGSPFRGGALGPIAFSPDARLLAAAGANLEIFSVDPSTGSLSPVSNPPIYGFSPAAVAFNPSGTLLAAPSSGYGGVALFSISASGLLAQISGLGWMPNSMFSTGADTPAPSAAFDGAGGLLALGERGAGVSILKIH